MNLPLLRRILHADLTAARRRLESLEAPSSPEQRAGGNDVDGDCAVATMNQEEVARSRASLLVTIRALTVAIGRCESGEYGVCVGCHREIPAARLKAVPTADHCVACKAAMETRATKALRGRGWEPEDDEVAVVADDPLSGFPAARDKGEPW